MCATLENAPTRADPILALFWSHFPRLPVSASFGKMLLALRFLWSWFTIPRIDLETRDIRTGPFA
jgi:hypothetical protein